MKTISLLSLILPWTLATPPLLISYIAGVKPAYYIFLTSDVNSGIPSNSPTDNFDCHQKIYAVFEGTGLKKGRHTLEGFWTNPKGKQQEYTRYEFEASREKEIVWLWLELRPGDEKLFKTVTPSYGTEYFSGKWTVRLYLDGSFLTEKFFHVIC